MQSNYIVRTAADALCCFYHEKDSGISQRVYKNGKWAQPLVLAQGARENYTVNIAYDGSLYIFTQDSEGNVNLCTNRSGAWQTQIILKSQKDTAFRIIFSAIITGRGLNLLYNVPGEDGKTQVLVSQQLNQSGRWGTANKIEPFVNLPDCVFKMQPVTPEHGLVFYQKTQTGQQRTVETSAGYREIDAEKVGEYNVFHTTTFPIIDYTFLTTYSAVHVAFIVKGMFSCQLIYRKKTDTAFSNPVVVYEGAKIDNCLLCFIKGKLSISFTANGQMYVCTSVGSGFSAAARYMNKICQNPVKACYLSAPAMSEKGFFCREIYVDRLCPWDIQMLPDMYEDFFPAPVPLPANPRPEKGMDDILQEMENLKKQLEALQLKLLEKEAAIKELKEEKRNEAN